MGNWYEYLYQYPVLGSRVGVLHFTEIDPNAFIDTHNSSMTHILPSRWPKLCEYIDTDNIVSHWPKAQGDIWSLPPSINIALQMYHTVWKPDEHWQLGQRLNDNSGYTWRYQKTTWYIDKRMLTLWIWQHSVKRTHWWEYSIKALAFDHTDTLIGVAEKEHAYAGPYKDQYPPWLRTWWLSVSVWLHPYKHFSITVTPSSLANMYPEIPVRLADGT